MNFEPQTYSLGEERDRIDDRLDELAEKMAEAEEDTHGLDTIRDEAAQLERQLGDLKRLISEYDEDETVTVKGLTTGEYARVQDEVASSHRSGDSPGAKRNMMVAEGLKEAPFLDEEDPDSRSATLAIASLPIGVTLWLEDLVEQETRADEGNLDSFAERVRAKQEH